MIGGGGPNDGPWIGPFAKVIGALLLSPFIKQEMGMMIADVTPGDLTLIANLIQQGKVTPVIDRRYPLREVPDAIAYLEEGHARGKVIITME
jgi:NADPH:quinone reductase-like Zn-dependent oxidoreductase